MAEGSIAERPASAIVLARDRGEARTGFFMSLLSAIKDAGWTGTHSQENGRFQV
jgi:hypothetical protein